MILNVIKSAVKEYDLIEKGDSVLVGLSGGADSVCLTHALCVLSGELGITVYAAHLNHGIRGAEADRDENFVKNFAKSLGIKCFAEKADIPQLSREMGISEETAGRKFRYEFFDKLCEQYNITKIATAHNKNDNAETILMNFMRGSAVAGLCGIPPRRGNIIRPLLCADRAQIERYCADNALMYVTDSTNGDDGYTRNKIRHTLLPLIEKEFNSNFINTAADNASIFKEDSDYLESAAKERYLLLAGDGKISASALLNEPPSMARRVVRYMLRDVYGGLGNVTSGYVRDVLSLAAKQSGAKIVLPNDVTARNEYGTLVIERGARAVKPFCAEVKRGETVFIKEISKTVTVTEAVKRQNDGAVYLACGDNDRIVIRSRREGDKFYPNGMTGGKKLKEYFINEKIPKEKRNSVPVIEINGRIAAVGGRVDRNFLFTDSGVRIEFKSLEVED